MFAIKLGNAKAEFIFTLLVETAYAVFQSLHLVQDRGSLIDKDGTGRGQRYLEAAAEEKLDSEVLLQPGDVLAQSRLADKKQFGRLGKTLRAADC